MLYFGKKSNPVFLKCNQGLFFTSVTSTPDLFVHKTINADLWVPPHWAPWAILHLRIHTSYTFMAGWDKSKEVSNKFNEKCITLFLFCFGVHKYLVFAFHTLFKRNWNIFTDLIRNAGYFSLWNKIQVQQGPLFFLVVVDFFSTQWITQVYTGMNKSDK